MHRTVLMTLSAALAGALTACGTERAAGPAAEPVAAEPTPTASAPAIPADFPLDAGVPRDADVDVTGPGPDVQGVSFDQVCGSTAWPGPPEERAGRLAVFAVGPEYSLGRELVVYDTEEAAAEVVAALRADVADCRGTGERVVRAFEAPTDRDAVTFGATYREGVGGDLAQVVRVGRAVLAVSEYGEYAPESIGDAVPHLTQDGHPLTERMAVLGG